MAAAAIPLLIHLLNRRKIKRIPFSTVQFLKRLEKKQMRNLRIRQWLLLLVRTAIILLLVLAFARPTLRTGGGTLLAQRSPIEAVIILDNSLSMNEIRMTGSSLEEMRQVFLRLEEAFQVGDRITVLQGTLPVRTLMNQEAFSADGWERVVQKINPGFAKSSLGNALLLAVEKLRQSVFSTREIYVISDFQESAFERTALDEALKTAAENAVKIFVLPIRHQEKQNLAVDSVEVVNRLVEIQQPLRIRAYIRNPAAQGYATSLVSVLLNGNRVAQQNISVGPDQVKQADFELTLTESGFVEGRVELEGDALPDDNRYYFNFFVPEKIRLLHLTTEAESPSYLPLIVQPARDRGIFEYQREALPNWSSRNLNDFDVILLEGLNQFPEALLLRLSAYLEQGGGLIVIPGEEIVPPVYNSFLRKMNLAGSATLRGNPGEADQFLTVQDVRWTHPVFEGLFEKSGQQISPTEVYAFYHTTPLPAAETLIELSDRSPFLLHSSVGRGAVFFLGTALQPRWSQLPTKGFVIPLFYRMIYFAGTRKVPDRQHTRTGEIARLSFANLQAPFDFRFSDGSGVDVRITPRFKGSAVFLEFRETDLPGNYHLTQNERNLSVVSVNGWREESRQDFLSDARIGEWLPGSMNLNAGEEMLTQIQQNRFGKELWQPFLIAAIILLLVEMLLARTGARKEFQNLPAEEVTVKSAT